MLSNYFNGKEQSLFIAVPSNFCSVYSVPNLFRNLIEFIHIFDLYDCNFLFKFL